MKMARIQLILFATSAALCLSMNGVRAQGTAFTYQGRLNVSGAPASGTYDFRYRLALDPYGNNYFGSSVLASGQVISNGLFTASLDFGASAFNGGSYWLEVDVRTNGAGGYTALSPLQPVTPAPYAMFSGNSSNAVNAATAATAATATYATTAGTVGANGVNNVAILNNAVTSGKIGGGQVVKSLTVGANTLYDNVTLAQGNNVTLTPNGQTVTIAAAGGQAVTSLNGLQGAVTLAGNSDVTVSASANTLTLGTTAVSANTASTIVKRDANGGFSAGTVTLGGNLNLPSSGIIYLGSSPFLHASGSWNFFGGFGAGSLTAPGNDNVGIGGSALSQSTGNANTAIGYLAMSGNNTGNANIALGVSAGSQLTTGNRNICIGNPGVAGDTGTIRIGDQNTYSAVIAGIYGNNIANAIPVYISPAGSLGTSASSAKFKEDIESMSNASEVLYGLKPVTFRYKPSIDPQGMRQFGLVAEDVDKVDPQLVVRDKEHGIYTVRYQAVDAMLLNEFIKEHRKGLVQDAEIQALKAKTAELDEVKERLSALEGILKAKNSSNP